LENQNIFKDSISENNGIKLIRKKDKNILSVGISTGGSAEIRMIKKNESSHVVATTIDNEGLEFTKKIINQLGFNDRIEIKSEDVSKKLPYEDGYFDFIYARLVLHYLNNYKLKNTLTELKRILKKDGILYIVVRSKNDWEAKLNGTTCDEITGMTSYPDYRKIGTESVRYISRRLHTQESLKTFLEDTGFKIKYMKEYNEQLYHDYMRTEKVIKSATVIETCVSI